VRVPLPAAAKLNTFLLRALADAKVRGLS
jgi:hypothetical protein